MLLVLMRKSRNPDRFCISEKAIFTKQFNDVNVAARWYAKASRSCYLYDIRKAIMPEKIRLANKVWALLKSPPSMADDYKQWMLNQLGKGL